MSVKLVKIHEGQVVPALTIAWAFSESACPNEKNLRANYGEYDKSEYATSKTAWHYNTRKNPAWQVMPGNVAWAWVWVDEPEKNEWGEVSA